MKQFGESRGVCVVWLLLASSLGILAQETPKPLGKLVDLGGHRLHLYCTGKGSPTVVIEMGFEEFSSDWGMVQDPVAKFARVCSYDRAGYAWSDPGPMPRTFAQINLELRSALAHSGEHGPYILVGHSYGGGVVRNFALSYPKQVAGMVFVDIVSENQRIPMGPKKTGLISDYATHKPIPEPRLTMEAKDKVVPEAAMARSLRSSLHSTSYRWQRRNNDCGRWRSLRCRQLPTANASGHRSTWRTGARNRRPEALGTSRLLSLRALTAALETTWIFQQPNWNSKGNRHRLNWRSFQHTDRNAS